jgi:SARP family transcriptional regulator, regulator of embCAB operon
METVERGAQKLPLGALEVGVLGPMSVRVGGIDVAASAPKQRQVLALLALNVGRVVTVSTLNEELWGQTPPRSHATTLQTYVLQLRKALAAADPTRSCARRLLSTRHNGYLLERGECETDVDQFKRVVVSGRAAFEVGDFSRASSELSRALELCRGDVLVDVRRGSVLNIEAASLEETRLGALERRIEADMSLGRHTDLIGELTHVAASNPLNENFSAYLMLAHYRAGRTGGSLEAFHRARSVLRGELGVDPGPRLIRLQSAILSGDPALGTWMVSRPQAALSGTRPAEA